MDKPRILLLTLGGTISGIPTVDGSRPGLTGADLLAAIPQTEEVGDITCIDVSQIAGREISLNDMCTLAHEINGRVAAGFAGIVVTQGTDTMEETAYALELQLDPQVPVVVTGAMRAPHDAGADGPANLLAALVVATTPTASRLGPLVVMNDEIHLARWVTKTRTSELAAFASPGLGRVGHVAEGKAHLHVQSVETGYLGLPTTLDKRVELVWVAAGGDGLLIDAAASQADGLVIAGTGVGHVPPGMIASLEAALLRGVPIVLASRCTSGNVLSRTYAGPGSESHLAEIGVQAAGNLSPLKTRLRLLVALSLGKPLSHVFPV